MTALLSEVSANPDSMHNLLQELYLCAVHLDITEVKKDTQHVIKSLILAERISLFLFSNYSKILGTYEKTELVKLAMQTSGMAFEKLGDYLEHTISQDVKPEELSYKKARYYLRASIAYTLGDNPPNSVVIARKFQKELTKLKEPGFIPIELLEIYDFAGLILNRTIQANRTFSKIALGKILTLLRQYLQTGEEQYFQYGVTELKQLRQECLSKYDITEFWVLSYLELCLEKIYINSVWKQLKGKYSSLYIQQLIKSRPSVIELWPNQIEILDNPSGFFSDTNILRGVITLPTSGGKSLLAELAIVRELEAIPGRTCIYIVPTNALAYEVTQRLRSRFRRLNYSVQISPDGFEGDVSEENSNIIVTTPEKLFSSLLNHDTVNFFDNVALIIFDEVHKMSEPERGWVIEGTIWFLINHSKYKEIKLLLISAILDNGEQILNWLNSNESDVPLAKKPIINDWRPTAKLKSIVDFSYQEKLGRWIPILPNHKLYKEGYKGYLAQANLKFLNKEGEMIKHLPLFEFPRYHNIQDNKVSANNIKLNNFIMGLAQSIKKTGGTLIFFNTKADCEEFIREYTPFFPEVLQIIEEVELLIKYIEKRLGKNHLLITGLRKGVVYHHGSIPLDVREALEEYFHKGYLEVMVCTTTLAEGVNFPIQNFIYTGRKYPNQRTVDIGDFKNIVGRAGRAYQSTYGQVLFVKFYPENIVKSHLIYEQHPNNVMSSIFRDNVIRNLITELNEKEDNEIDGYLDEVSDNGFFKTLLLFFNYGYQSPQDMDNLFLSSLFGRQLEREALIPYNKATRRIYSYYSKKDNSEREAVQHSGLSFKSYGILRSLSNTILKNVNTLPETVEIHDIITEDIFKVIVSLRECESFKVRRSTPTSRIIQINYYSLLIDWVENGLAITELAEKHFQEVDEKFRSSRCFEYIRDMYEFKLPRVLTVISKLCCDSFALIFDNIKAYYLLKNLPMFIKFGLNSEAEVDLVKVGFNSRETIKDLAKYTEEYVVYKDLDGLKNFFMEFDPLVLMDKVKSLTDYEVKKITSLANNFRDVTSQIELLGNIQTHIASTKYNLCKLDHCLEVIKMISKTGLRLERERNNFYDENAIAIYCGKDKIGYISRKVNEEIAYYLDLYYNPQIEIKNLVIVDIKSYIEILIEISFD